MNTQSVRLLLVDDEPALLRLMQHSLTRLGYEVNAHENGKSALAAFDGDPDGFHLLVADLTLSDIPGNELGLEMVRRNPNIRVLLCSGYPFDTESLPADVRHLFGSLQKPFLPNELARMIEGILPPTGGAAA
jgi:DNA-binding NtrC family response regulator